MTLSPLGCQIPIPFQGPREKGACGGILRGCCGASHMAHVCGGVTGGFIFWRWSVSYFQAQSMVRTSPSLMKMPHEMGKSRKHTVGHTHQCLT